MSDGYVQVRFNYLTRQTEQGTGPHPHQWMLVHDAAGKLVVRDHENVVIATARWFEQEATHRVHRTLDVPSEAQWSAIQHAIGGAIREVERFPPNPALDEGVVERPAIRPRGKNVAKGKDNEEDKKPDEPIGIIGWIGAALVVGVLGFVLFMVLFWVIPWLKKHDLMPEGTTANGAACTTDSDCKSGDCYRQTCRGEAVKVRGDRCDRDGDCKSGSCQHSSNTCN